MLHLYTQGYIYIHTHAGLRMYIDKQTEACFIYIRRAASDEARAARGGAAWGAPGAGAAVARAMEAWQVSFCQLIRLNTKNTAWGCGNWLEHTGISTN